MGSRAGHTVILVSLGSGHEVYVREACEAEPDEGTTPVNRLCKDVCSEFITDLLLQSFVLELTLVKGFEETQETQVTEEARGETSWVWRAGRT